MTTKRLIVLYWAYERDVWLYVMWRLDYVYQLVEGVLVEVKINILLKLATKLLIQLIILFSLKLFLQDSLQSIEIELPLKVPPTFPVVVF